MEEGEGRREREGVGREGGREEDRSTIILYSPMQEKRMALKDIQVIVTGTP